MKRINHLAVVLVCYYTISMFQLQTSVCAHNYKEHLSSHVNHNDSSETDINISSFSALDKDGVDDAPGRVVPNDSMNEDIQNQAKHHDVSASDEHKSLTTDKDWTTTARNEEKNAKESQFRIILICVAIATIGCLGIALMFTLATRRAINEAKFTGDGKKPGIDEPMTTGGLSALGKNLLNFKSPFLNKQKGIDSKDQSDFHPDNQFEAMKFNSVNKLSKSSTGDKVQRNDRYQPQNALSLAQLRDLQEKSPQKSNESTHTDGTEKRSSWSLSMLTSRGHPKQSKNEKKSCIPPPVVTAVSTRGRGMRPRKSSSSITHSLSSSETDSNKSATGSQPLNDSKILQSESQSDELDAKVPFVCEDPNMNDTVAV